MNNKKLGNEFERALCELLFNKGFWVHNFANKTTGQPADIIACKNKIALLIDAKECTRDSYDTRRIEENQKNSMFLWEQCGNGVGYFALKLSDETIYMINHNAMLLARQHKRTLNKNDIVELGIPFTDWVVQFE